LLKVAEEAENTVNIYGQEKTVVTAAVCLQTKVDFFLESVSLLISKINVF
jgi:hypothetical protein